MPDSRTAIRSALLCQAAALASGAIGGGLGKDRGRLRSFEALEPRQLLDGMGILENDPLAIQLAAWDAPVVEAVEAVQVGLPVVDVVEVEPIPVAALPQVSVRDAAAVEGGELLFAVSLSQASEAPVHVAYRTFRGTADESDFESVRGELVFLPGETEQSVTVAACEDDAAEPTEHFWFGLVGASGATIADAQATGTVFDAADVAAAALAPAAAARSALFRSALFGSTQLADFGGRGGMMMMSSGGLPYLSISDASAAEGDSVTFTVWACGTIEEPIYIDWATSDGSALAGADYQAASGSLVFEPGGPTWQSFTVATSDNPNSQGDKFFSVALTAVSGAGVQDGDAVGTILDRDTPVHLFVDDAWPMPENSGSVSFYLWNDVAAPRQTVAVNYATRDVTATAWCDYTPVAGQWTIAPGGSTSFVGVAVSLIDDGQYEGDETFALDLSNPQWATLGSSTGLATILDNDPEPPPTISVSASPTSVTEGDSTSAAFVLTFSRPFGHSGSLWFDLSGTATNGADYHCAFSAGASFGGWETQVTVPVDFSPWWFDDTAIEGDETITLTVQPSYNNDYQLDPLAASATITINDNDFLPTVSISSTPAVISEEACESVVFTVERTGSLSQDLMVYYTVSGTADNGADYNWLPGWVTIPAWYSTAQFATYALDDAYYEGPETLIVELVADSYSPSYYLNPEAYSTVAMIAEGDEPRVTGVEFVQIGGTGYGQLELGTNPDGTNGTPAFQGGDRFFPDAWNHCTTSIGNNVVRVRARVSGVDDDQLGELVYFRAFDVDDPHSSVTEDDQLIDPSNTGNDNRGRLKDVNFGQATPDSGGMPDNSRDPDQGGFSGFLRAIDASGNAGVWEQLTAGRSEARAPLRKDAQGRYFAEVDLATSYAPGDNFRVAAAIDQARVQELEAKSPDDVPTNGDERDFTRQLSVWRYCHVEQDRMQSTASADHQAGQISENSAQPADGMVWVQTNLLVSEANEYEGGLLRTGGVNYEIVAHDTGTTLEGDVVSRVDRGNGVVSVEIQFTAAINIAENTFVGGTLVYQHVDTATVPQGVPIVYAVGPEYAVNWHQVGNGVVTVEVDISATALPALGRIRLHAANARFQVQTQVPQPIAQGAVEVLEDDYKMPDGDENGEPVVRVNTESFLARDAIVGFMQNSTLRAHNRFADAYVVMRTDTLDDFDSLIPPVSHLESLNQMEQLIVEHAGVEDYRTSTFWSVWVCSAYESGRFLDGDPSPVGTQAAALGVTVQGNWRQLGSYIFLESLRDAWVDQPLLWGNELWGWTAATGVHEIGHQFNLSRKGTPDDTRHDDSQPNIMCSTLDAAHPSFFFTAKDIAHIRSQSLSPCTDPSLA